MESWLLLWLLLCLALGPAIAYNYQRTTRRRSLPPGPLCIPGLGNPVTTRRLNTAPARTCNDLAQRYGDLATIWLGKQPIILVNSPCTAHELLQKGASTTASRPTHNHFRFKELPSRIVLTPAGEDFKRLRGLYSGFLGKGNLKAFQKIQTEESVVLLRGLLDRPEGFLFECDRYAINVLFRAIYDARLDEGKDDLIKSTYKIWEMVYLCFLPGSLIIDYLPLLLKLPKWMQPWVGIIENLKWKEQELHEPYFESVMRSRQMGSKDYNGFALDLLANSEKSDLDSQTIVSTLAMVLGAASDTTSAVIQLVFKVMALHPNALRMAQAEIDEVVGVDRLPNWQDEPRLPYFRAMMKELHRWAPIAIAGVPHATTEDITYREYIIPANTILIPNIPALSRSAERYECPDIFDPLRFIGDKQDAAASARSADFMNRDHFQFGFGRRFCPGSYVAEGSLYMGIVCIFWAFDIQAVEGHPLDMGEQRLGLLKKPKPFPVRLSPRSQQHIDLINSSHS